MSVLRHKREVGTHERYEPLKHDPAALIALLLERDREIERLHVHLSNINRKTFVKKNERLEPSAQGELFAFEAGTPVATEEEQTVDVPAHKRRNRGRKPLPATLPTRREEHWPEQKECSQCGSTLKKIGEEITRELEFIPAHFEVIEHAKIKCACPRCESEGVATGALPPSAQPLPGARPGAGLLSYILVSKYVDHLPLHRLEQMFARHGIIIPRQRMSDWLGGLMIYLEILWWLLKAEILGGDYVQADETYIKVRQIETAGQLLQGYFWAVHAPPNLAFFQYFDTRAGEAAKEVLKGFQGRVQTDAYAGYNPVLLPETVERIACLAHIRRRFIEHRGFAPAECDKIVRQIAKLYALEAKWKNLSSADRYLERQAVARLELEKLYALLADMQSRLLPRHGLQEHLSYALNQREAMFRYLQDGRYLIDNNSIERQIRPIAIGRKNYLFAGSHDGARRAAVFYSLLATAKLNNVNPTLWIADVLRRMPAMPRSQYHELLPHRWTPVQEQHPQEKPPTEQAPAAA